MVGMLLYLSNNLRPDIQFAVHQCARFTHCPRDSDAKAIKQIVRYLKATRETGLTFSTDVEMKLNMYADADFAGLYGVENEQDPVCVKSRTGYVLFLGGCPISWCSKLQTEIALSTLEAEYIALSQAMRELLPQRELLQEIGDRMGLSYTQPTILHSSVFEDNNGALQLAQSPKISPRTKHIAVKYHFFRSHIGEDKGILITRVESENQIADMFTKGLAAQSFEPLRKKLMGW